MTLSNPSLTQWGKLTSLNPAYDNISLSKNPSSLVFTPPLEGSNVENALGTKYEYQIYQGNEGYFISYTADSLVIQINDQIVSETEAFRIHSGDRILLISSKKSEESMEYIFSAELAQSQKEALKRDREEKEETAMHQKKTKFQEEFKDASKCRICWKMIYECVSVVPCLHSFCMDCFMRRLRRSQACHECGERLVEFRKNVFMNNLIEGYEESGYQRDRSPEEYKELCKKLDTEKVFTRFEYADGGVYEGEWRKCRRDGRGKMTFENGDIYEGDWKSGHMEGIGKVIYVDGDIYEGDFKRNMADGKGKIVYSDGGFYEGEWKAHKKEGKGRLVRLGMIYEGDFKGDKIEGEGKFTYRNGDFYEGSWENSKKQGKGKMVQANGETYEGDWKRDIMDGQGKYTWKNGKVYEGDFRVNQIEGQGKMIYEDGSVYEGGWKNEKREGQGKMDFADGSVYEGNWRNDKREGKGKMRYPNGGVYEVKCRNDKVKSRRKITDKEDSRKKKRN